MAEIVKIYRQSLPAMKLVGKRYGEKDKVNGFFGAKWGEWFENNLFAPLVIGGDEPFEDSDAYIGMCRLKEGEPYEYWIGAFLPLDFKVPEGYESMELKAGDTAVVWVRGKEPDVYTCDCLEEVIKAGYKWEPDENGVRLCFERYACPRFTTPDNNGNIILDMCFYLG